MGNQYRDKDTGAVVTLEGNDALNAVRSGRFEPATEGGSVPIQMESGAVGTVTPEQAQGNLDGIVGANPVGLRLAQESAAEEQLYNSPEHASEAFGTGILSGLSLGTTDLLLSDEQRASAEHRPGWRLGGEIGGSLTLGLGAGVAGRVGKTVGGGLKGHVLGNIVEGAGFGVGQGFSNIALADPGMSGEAIADELIKNGLYGIGFGAAGGLLAGGLEGVAAKQASKASKIEEATAFLHSEAAKASGSSGRLFPHLDDAATNNVTRGIVDGYNEAEAAAQHALDAGGTPFIADDIIYSARLSRQMTEEAEGLAEFGVKGDLLGPKTREIKAALARADKADLALGEIWGVNTHFSRSEFLDAGGRKLLQSKPELWAKSAKPLEDLRLAAEDVNRLAGMGGKTTKAKFYKDSMQMEMGTAEETAEMLSRDPHLKIRAVARGETKFEPRPELNGAVEAIGEVRETTKQLNKALGIKGSRPLTDDDLKRFLLLDKPQQAVGVATAMQNHLTSLKKVVSALDDGLAGQKWAAAEQKIADALSKVRGAAESGTTADLMAQAGIKGASGAVGLKGPADDLLGAWVSRSMAKGEKGLPEHLAAVAKQKGIKEDVVLSFLRDAGRSASYGIGRDAARDFAKAAGLGGVGMRLLQGGLGVMAGRFFGGIVDLAAGASEVAQATGSHTARIARGVSTLARRGSKAARAVAPTATAMLNAYSFGTDDGTRPKNLHEAYRKRVKELSQFAANPVAAQKQIHDNLEPIRQIHPMLADNIEMQAVADAQHFFETAPKDPGGQSVLGLSRWKPTEDDIVRWASRFRALDPAGVWERVVSGRVTPQEAETLRAIRPNTFAEIQRQLMENLPEVQANASYDQQIRMTILFDVPVNSLASKNTVNFIQQQFAERAATDNEPVELNAGAFAKNEPSPADSIQSRA